MLTRITIAGMLLLTSGSVVGAADPVVPPAPTSEDAQNGQPLPEPIPATPHKGGPTPIAVPEQSSGPQNSSSPPARAPLPQTRPATPHSPAVPYSGNALPPPTTPHGATPEIAVPPSVPGQADWNTVPSAGTGPNVPYNSQFHGAPAYGAPGYNMTPGFGSAPSSVYPETYSPYPSYPGGAQYSSYPPMSNPALIGGEHARYPYYSYRRPWYTPGPVSRNVNIIW